MVAHDIRFAKGLLEADATHAERLSLSVGEVWIDDENLQLERSQALDQRSRHLPGADQRHGHVIDPWAAIALVRGQPRLWPIVTQIAKVALARQEDLGQRKLGHRDRVGSPGARHEDTAPEQGLGKAAHRARCIKDSTQARNPIQRCIIE